MMQTQKDRLQELEKLITYHNDLYWNLNKPAITDYEYDLLLRELEHLDHNNPLLSYVGTNDTDNIGKVTHKSRMLSLAKIYTHDDLLKWLNKVARSEEEVFMVQPKYDGISGSLQDGVLSTRGNGYIGENITRHLPYIRIEHPPEIKLEETWIRGELLIKKSTFNNLDSIYKTPRNMAAGLLNNKVLESRYHRCLTFVDFNSSADLMTLKEIENIKNFDDFSAGYQNLDYPTDGIVFKLADRLYADTFNTTAHHNNSEISLKFTNATATSKLLSVQFQAGKRKLTPVATIEPTIINGVTIERVTLHNYAFILERGICIDDTLTIERSGDVIPHVLANTSTKNAPLITCSECPYCGSETIYIDPDLFCPNDNCTGKLSRLLYESICRIGIKNVGQATTNKLIDILDVQDIRDILLIELSDINMLINTADSGFKEKSGKNLFNEIQTVLHSDIYDWQVLSALNIKGFGATLSKKVLNGRSLLELTDMTNNELCSIDGISEERSSELSIGLYKNNEILLSLLRILTIKQLSTESTSKNAKIFVLTGKFPVPKKDIIRKIESSGYSVEKTVTKSIDYLVTAGKESSKTKKAIKFNIPILSYSNLIEYLDSIIYLKNN